MIDTCCFCIYELIILYFLWQVADILFIVFCVPFTAADYYFASIWPFGEAWCRCAWCTWRWFGRIWNMYGMQKDGFVRLGWRRTWSVGVSGIRSMRKNVWFGQIWCQYGTQKDDFVRPGPGAAHWTMVLSDLSRCASWRMVRIDLVRWRLIG